MRDKTSIYQQIETRSHTLYSQFIAANYLSCTVNIMHFESIETISKDSKTTKCLQSCSKKAYMNFTVELTEKLFPKILSQQYHLKHYYSTKDFCCFVDVSSNWEQAYIRCQNFIEESKILTTLLSYVVSYCFLHNLLLHYSPSFLCN